MDYNIPFGVMKEIKILSLFSGAGGLDLGFHLEGFKIKACIEINKDACETLESNKGKYLSSDTKIYHQDITELSPKVVQKEIGTIDFIIGGPPCQSFSAAGRRAGGVSGVNDTRGSLFWYYVQYLNIFRPKLFLFENVKGILQSNQGRDWQLVEHSFRELGYNLAFRILDAADFGTPQHRERVILVGQLTDIPFKFPQPISGPNSSSKRPYVTPREAFFDIDDPNEIVPVYSGKYGHLLKDIPPGSNYSFYTERMGHPNPLFAWRSKFSGFLYKLHPDEPSKTLVAHQGKYDGPFHWKNRKLNTDELLRLQGFPLDYIFEGSRVSIEKQIGNSVAPKLAQYLAKAVLNQCFGADRIVIDLLEPDAVLTCKKKQRVIPRSRLQKFKPHALQLNLFEPYIDLHRDAVVLDLHSDFFDNECFLRDGEWNLKVWNRTTKNIVEIEINLYFYEYINHEFKRIKCLFECHKIEDFNYAWDFVHKIVDRCCSYDSLQPLYGHFTEPHPKFEMTVSTNRPESGIHRLMVKMSDYSFLSRLHHYSELDNIFGAKIEVRQTVEFLRKKGVEIRSHETNRTIPKNHFRICYPFSLPSWIPTYTKWIEIGSHETGDINIEELIGKSKNERFC